MIDSNKFRITRLEVILVFVAGLLQVLQAGWSLYLNRQTSDKIDEVKSSQDISDKILQSKPIMSGGDPAMTKVVLDALYVRAFSDDDKDDLARIAMLGDKRGLRDAIPYTIRTDSQSSPALAQKLNKLFSFIAVEQGMLQRPKQTRLVLA